MYRKLLKEIYFRGIEGLRLDRRRLASMPGLRQAAVLNFHRVSPDPSPYWPPMAPEVFRDAIDYVVRKFEIRTLAELDNEYGDKPIAVISFDDGYYDFIEYALPILTDYGIKPNMNVIPQCAETGNPMWLVALYDYLTASSFEEINALPIPGFSEKLAADSIAAKLAFGLTLSKYLKNRPAASRAEIWDPIERAMAVSSYPRTRMMTTDDFLSVADMIEIGVHSYSHESMAFETLEFFREDLKKCKTYFRERLSMPLTIYAFPNGSYREEHLGVLEENGISRILLVEEKPAQIGERAISRITMYGETPPQARMQTVGY